MSINSGKLLTECFPEGVLIQKQDTKPIGLTDFYIKYSQQIISYFVKHRGLSITRDEKPCTIYFEQGLTLQFADDATVFEFLNEAAHLYFGFASQAVYVDFLKWYQAERREKLLHTLNVDSDWQPTQADWDHIRDLEQNALENPCANIMVTRPQPFSAGIAPSRSCRYLHDSIVHETLPALESTTRIEIQDKDPWFIPAGLQNHNPLTGKNVQRLLDFIGPRIEEALDHTIFESNSPLKVFSDAPFKIVRNYIYACGFLHPYAPATLDYVNDLLGYQLSECISREKNVFVTSALQALRQEITDYVTHHPDACANLKAKLVKTSGIMDFSEAYRLKISSDYGSVTVTYEPGLTPVDWEKRYTDLRVRHGQR